MFIANANCYVISGKNKTTKTQQNLLFSLSALSNAFFCLFPYVSGMPSSTHPQNNTLIEIPLPVTLFPCPCKATNITALQEYMSNRIWQQLD